MMDDNVIPKAYAQEAQDAVERLLRRTRALTCERYRPGPYVTLSRCDLVMDDNVIPKAYAQDAVVRLLRCVAPVR